jgi:hypothetical protein
VVHGVPTARRPGVPGSTPRSPVRRDAGASGVRRQSSGVGPSSSAIRRRDQLGVRASARSCEALQALPGRLVGRHRRGAAYGLSAHGRDPAQQPQVRVAHRRPPEPAASAARSGTANAPPLLAQRSASTFAAPAASAVQTSGIVSTAGSTTRSFAARCGSSAHRAPHRQHVSSLTGHRSSAGAAQTREMSVAHGSALIRRRGGGIRSVGRVGADHVHVSAQDAHRLAEQPAHRVAVAARRRRCRRTVRRFGDGADGLARMAAAGDAGGSIAASVCMCDPSSARIADQRLPGCSVGGTALPSLGTKLSVRSPLGHGPRGSARSRFARPVKWPCSPIVLAGRHGPDVVGAIGGPIRPGLPAEPNPNTDLAGWNWC